jgi:hypothetical protein
VKIQGKQGKNAYFQIFELKCFLRAEKGHEPRRAELKIIQLKLWLEPALLGLITSIVHNFPSVLIHQKYITSASITQLYLKTKCDNFKISENKFSSRLKHNNSRPIGQGQR